MTKMLTIQEVQERLNISKSLAYKLIRLGEISSIRIGRALRVPQDALDQWIERQLMGSW